MTPPLEKDAVPVNISAPRYRGVIVYLLIGVCNCILLGFPVPELSVLESIVDVLAALFTGHNRPVFHGEIRPSPVRLQRYLRLAGLPSLRGDENYSVGRPGAIKRCCGRILDDCHALNVGAVDSRHNVELGI